MRTRIHHWQARFTPGLGILTMLGPLALLSFNIVPGRPLLPLGAQVAVLAVILPLPLLASRLRLTRHAGLGPLAWLWLLPGLISLASVIWSPQPALSLQRVLLVYLPGLALMALVAGDPRPWQTFTLVARAVVIAAVILAVVGVALMVLGQTRLTSEGFVQTISLGPLRCGQRLIGAPPFLRITSLTSNPNGLATWMVFGLLLLPAALPERLLRPWRTIAGLALVAGLLLTMSRTGLAAMLAALLVYQALRHPGRLVPLGLVALAVVAGLAMVVFGLRAMGIDLTGTDRLTFSLSSREEAWRPLVAAWRQHPWTGVGFGIGFEELLRSRGLRFGAHSGHLLLLAEIGTLGYLGILGFWCRGLAGSLEGLRRGRLPSRVGATCAALLVAYFVQQFFEASVMRFTFASSFWLYLVAVSVLARQDQENR
ncbi:MAG: O-antigen ligase family protein [Candidatus Krumholzibacteriia bacterium]